MKNYKISLFGVFILILGGVVLITNVDMPAPSKLNHKILDINDQSVR